MLRKELTEALKRFIESSLIFIGIPFAFLLDKLIIKFGWGFLDIFQGFFMATIVVYAVYSGLTIFQAEKKDRAIEYLLSLPISRQKIIAMKVLPRLVILIFFILILAIFMSLENLQAISIFLIFMFLISIFLSIVVDSILIGIIGAFLLFQVFNLSVKIILFLVHKAGIDSPDPFIGLIGLISMLLSAILLLVPFGISFWLTFKNMDLKPLKLQVRPYYYIALPSLIVLISLIALNYRGFLMWLQNL